MQRLFSTWRSYNQRQRQPLQIKQLDHSSIPNLGTHFDFNSFLLPLSNCLVSENISLTYAINPDLFIYYHVYLFSPSLNAAIHRLNTLTLTGQISAWRIWANGLPAG